MKDIFGKITFGFLMAQLVPGALCVLGIGLFFIEIPEIENLKLLSALRESLVFWLKNGINQIIFFLLSLGSGMAIHGLHWSTLGYLENNCDKGIREKKYHNWQLIVQVLTGPCIIIFEIIRLFFCGNSIYNIAIEENVPYISNDKMDAFHFLQDFYLHFAQFFAHTSYALIILFSMSAIACIRFKFVNWGILFGIYLMCGFFFIIGRIQLTTLFKAEGKLRQEHMKNLCT